MLDICSNQAADIDIIFNAKKSSVFAMRKLIFLRALCELNNLVVRTCFSVFKWSQKCREQRVKCAFNCIGLISVFSVVELKSVFSVHLVSWFMEILNLYF